MMEVKPTLRHTTHGEKDVLHYNSPDLQKSLLSQA